MPRTMIPALCLVFLHLAPTQIPAVEQGFDIDTIETTAIRSAEPSNDLEPASVLYGVYDPHDLFRHAPGIRIQHVFVYWQAMDKTMLTAKMRLASTKAQTLMVTVEPYTKAENWRDGGDHLFGIF